MLTVETYLRASPLHGIGLFARQFIAAGTIVWQLTPGFDIFYTLAEIDTLPPPARAQIKKYAYLDPYACKYVLCGDDARFFNHSDTPNVRGGYTDDGTELLMIALRSIYAGEELTCDYHDFDAEA